MEATRIVQVQGLASNSGLLISRQVKRHRRSAVSLVNLDNYFRVGFDDEFYNSIVPYSSAIAWDKEDNFSNSWYRCLLIMSKKEPPEGQLFSRVYLERPKPVQDSKRFRGRLSGYFQQNLSEINHRLAGLVRTELGVEVSWSHGPSFEMFFNNAEIRDVLDTISLVGRALDEVNKSSNFEPWIQFVRRVFDEESLGYRIDPKGGVHYVVDEEFERNRVSAIAALASPRYAAVAASLEQAFSHLDSENVNTKTAVRDVFDAMETLLKLLTNSNKNLDEKMVKREVGDLLRNLPEYKEHSGASTISKFIESLCDWVNAAHPYRHGQKTEILVAPSLASTVLFLSLGAAYMRWLVDQLGTAKN